jgi:GTP-binding protein HflX
MPTIQDTQRHTAALVLAPRLGQGAEPTLIELEKLRAGLGVKILETVVQRTTPLGSPHLIGSGKLAELKVRVQDQLELAPPGRDLVLVVAADITPADQRSLERAVDLPVWDRSAVILRVFGQRATTALARLEVDLARARYELPRARDDSSLGDREGGGGRAARGHTGVELKKQQFRRLIVDLERRIAAAECAVAVQTKARASQRRVALVGYTNAGKSSLLQALCGRETYVADELFATLSTTVRALPRASPPLLVSDTVGFMRSLPHELLRSFRSTLSEAIDADLRLVVVDASDADFVEQLAVTLSVLDDLGADRDAEILVFNKVDRMDAEVLRELSCAYSDALFISAHREDDVKSLRRSVVEFFDAASFEVTVVVPFSDGKRLAELHAQTHVVAAQAVEGGMQLRVRGPADSLARLGLVHG